MSTFSGEKVSWVFNFVSRAYPNSGENIHAYTQAQKAVLQVCPSCVTLEKSWRHAQTQQ